MTFLIINVIILTCALGSLIFNILAMYALEEIEFDNLMHVTREDSMMLSSMMGMTALNVSMLNITQQQNLEQTGETSAVS